MTSEEPNATANPLPILERIPKSLAIALIFSIPISFANLTATVFIDPLSAWLRVTGPKYSPV